MVSVLCPISSCTLRRSRLMALSVKDRGKLAAVAGLRVDIRPAAPRSGDIMRTPGVIVALCLIFTVPAGAKRLHLHKPAHGFQMRMTPLPIPVGGEREACEYQVTPNRK